MMLLSVRKAVQCRFWQSENTIPFKALHVAEKVDLVSKQVAECLGGKGGGRSGRYQGKAPHITQAQVQDAMKRMSQAIAAGSQFS